MKIQIETIETPVENGLQRALNVLQTPDVDVVYTSLPNGCVDGKMARVYQRGSEWFWEPSGNATGSYYTPLTPVKIYVRILSNDV